MSTIDPYVPWAEIDLSAITANVSALKRRLTAGTRLLVAVKADGYGHGAVPVAATALASGADTLGVARLDEALALRRAGIAAPILVFGPAAPALAPEFAAHAVTASVSGCDEAAALAAHLRRRQTLRLHLEVDTGMGRLGLLAQTGDVGELARTIADEVDAIQALPGVHLEGIFTHFAEADHADSRHPAEQMRILAAAVRLLEARGTCPALVHAANSAAIFRDRSIHGNMVRAGLAAYGLDPTPGSGTTLALRPALSLKARILHLKRVDAGTTISYGRTHRVDRPTVIATVPIGYGDGYSRALSNRGEMLVGARRVPIVGRVCMDLTMLDLGPTPEVAVGDEVVAIGSQGAERIGADEIAARIGTISYEIVTALTPRVRREYHAALSEIPATADPTTAAIAIAC